MKTAWKVILMDEKDEKDFKEENSLRSEEQSLELSMDEKPKRIVSGLTKTGLTKTVMMPEEEEGGRLKS